MKYTARNIGKAIKKLVPNARFDVVGNSLEGIHWLDDKKEKPSDSSIISEIEKQETEFKNKQYQRDRKIQYPKIEDVVVALAEKEEGDDTMWKQITAQRAKVKSDNPKPE